MNDRETIGRRIREIMDAQGVSTLKLAEMTGLHQPNVQRVISGRYSVGVDVLAKIARALHCRLDLVENDAKMKF